MIGFLIFVYVVIAIIAATLSFIQLIEMSRREWNLSIDVTDITLFSILAPIMGLFWPFTLWVGIILNYTTPRDYAWIRALKDCVNFIKEKVKKCKK